MFRLEPTSISLKVIIICIWKSLLTQAKWYRASFGAPGTIGLLLKYPKSVFSFIQNLTSELKNKGGGVDFRVLNSKGFVSRIRIYLIYVCIFIFTKQRTTALFLFVYSFVESNKILYFLIK